MSHPFDWVIPYYRAVSRQPGWGQLPVTEKISQLRGRIVAHPPKNALSAMGLVEWWDETARWTTILAWLEERASRRKR